MTSLFVSAAFKSTAIFALAWVLTIVLRGRSAAWRHLVWTGAFAAALALPVLSAFVPAWAVSMPEAGPGAIFRTATSMPQDSPAVAPATGTIPGQMKNLPAWRPGLLILWATGAALSFLHLLASWMRISVIRRGAALLPGIEISGLAEELGIRGQVEVRRTGPGNMPMAFGLFRRTVFLPADVVDWSAERRRLVLLHELAHLQRGDILTNLVARIALCLYWWNPLVWMAWRQFLKERERAADDLVLSCGSRASDYAGHLLEIARSLQTPRALGSMALAMARRSDLEGRLLAILDTRVSRKGIRGRSVAFVAALAVAAIAPFAALRAQDRIAELPVDADATIRAAAGQKNHEMLETAAKAAEVVQQYDLARRLLDASLSVRADLAGAQSVEYGVGLIQIGDLERSRKNLAEAEAFYTKAASVLGSRPAAVPALVNLGILAWKGRDSDLAFDYFQRAQVADPPHAGIAISWMALVREQQKNVDEAEALFKEALGVEDPGSPEAALTNELYSAFLSRQKRDEEARPVQAAAAAIRKELGAQAVTFRLGSGMAAVRVGGGVSAPKLVYKIEPEYTEEARLAKYQGTVVVSTVIGTDGAAQSLKVARGLGLGLDEQALKAIARWKFQPGAKEGQPVPVQATIEVNFRLL